jgi:hypothetical protein
MTTGGHIYQILKIILGDAHLFLFIEAAKKHHMSKNAPCCLEKFNPCMKKEKFIISENCFTKAVP